MLNLWRGRKHHSKNDKREIRGRNMTDAEKGRKREMSVRRKDNFLKISSLLLMCNKCINDSHYKQIGFKHKRYCKCHIKHIPEVSD